MEAGAGAVLVACRLAGLSALGGTMRISTPARNASTCGCMLASKSAAVLDSLRARSRALSRTPLMGAPLPSENDDSAPENGHGQPFRAAAGRVTPAKTGKAASGQIWGS